MKIGEVKIKDFLAIGEATFSLDDLGLVSVQGQNFDNTSSVSNGAGKSSLMDAVMWCLFGVTARGASTSEVIRHGAKEAQVDLDLLEDDGSIYRVTRNRSKSKSGLWLTHIDASGGGVIALTGGTTAITQATIERALGCSAEVFRAAVYLGQEQMPDLPGMTDKRLKELIEEAAGLSLIEACYEKARSRVSVVEAELAVVRAQRENADKNLVTAKDILREAEEDARAWNERHLDQICDAARRFVETSDKLSAAVQAHGDQKAAAGQAAKRILEINGTLKGFQATQGALRTARDEVVKLERRVAGLEGAAKSAIRDTQIQEAHLHHIITGHPCESCGQDLPADQLAAITQGAQDAVAAARTAAQTAARDVKAYRERAAQARSHAEEIERSLPDVTTLQAESEACRLIVAGFQKLAATRDALNAEVQKLGEELTAMRDANNPCDPAITRATALVDKWHTAFEENKRRERVLETKVSRAKDVVAVFGPGGVRAEILDQVTPYLNARTAAYLDPLSDSTLKAEWTTLVRDSKGNLKEKFSILVTHPAGEGFGVLSGGEKRKVRLAAALALQDLVSSRATKPLHLFVADEIDDALDEAGLERLMGVLGEKAREKGTVMVISHNSLTDWIPNSWTVSKRGKIATLETT